MKFSKYSRRKLLNKLHYYARKVNSNKGYNIESMNKDEYQKLCDLLFHHLNLSSEQVKYLINNPNDYDLIYNLVVIEDKSISKESIIVKQAKHLLHSQLTFVNIVVFIGLILGIIGTISTLMTDGFIIELLCFDLLIFTIVLSHIFFVCLNYGFILKFNVVNRFTRNISSSIKKINIIEDVHLSNRYTLVDVLFVILKLSNGEKIYVPLFDLNLLFNRKNRKIIKQKFMELYSDKVYTFIVDSNNILISDHQIIKKIIKIIRK